jgi:hypothetical protein
MKTIGLAVLASFGLALFACSGGANDAASSDDSEGALEIAGADLAGTYENSDRSGTSRPPTFEKLVLGRDGAFQLDVDTGIRCITAPCPSSTAVVGTFRSTRTTLTLAPVPGGVGSKYYGTYKLSRNELQDVGANITLTRTGSDWAGWKNVLVQTSAQSAAEAGIEAGTAVGPEAGAEAGTSDDCFGAWMDQNGSCRSPVDGVYPASCCDGTN